MKKGFTLIELLVVIAIIGILSAIVLASLNSARSKAVDTSVKGVMDQMRKQTEIYYSINGDYGENFQDFCYRATGAGNGIPGTQTPDSSLNIFGPNVDDGLYPLMVEVMTKMSNPWHNNGSIHLACRSTGQQWGIRMPLPSNIGSWCVDSTGYAGPASGMQGPLCIPS